MERISRCSDSENGEERGDSGWGGGGCPKGKRLLKMTVRGRRLPDKAFEFLGEIKLAAVARR